MTMKKHILVLAVCLAAVGLSGCASKRSVDYTEFRAHPPRSILVLPPINESTEVGGTYGFLSTATMPIAEKGYYVFPVSVVDQYMKENGLPTAGEMHQVPLEKIRDIIGADAVLYLDLKDYGSKYQVIASTTRVNVTAKLVDVKSGQTIWTGASLVEQSSSGGSGNIIADLIATALDQVLNSTTDYAHTVSRTANYQLVADPNTGLLDGPYAPKK
ncbi:DUF799 domain-containing protein [Rhizomicrobium electricum]|jgi:hypothetical protein|uniref:DUF799 domain-containing protein n=2 Tax=Rhizomicrobium electricum TaxID=480070 RepID=A0ABP3P114_9PROT